MNEGTALSNKKTVEVFSGGCHLCQEAVRLVKRVAGDSFDVKVRDIHDSEHAAAAESYGVERFPAVALDGKLTDCTIGMTEESLKSAGIGT